MAEQAAAIVGLTVLGLDDGRKPNSQSPNDDVARVWREEFQTEDREDSIYRHKTVNSERVQPDINSVNRKENGLPDSIQSGNENVENNKCTQESVRNDSFGQTACRTAHLEADVCLGHVETL